MVERHLVVDIYVRCCSLVLSRHELLIVQWSRRFSLIILHSLLLIASIIVDWLSSGNHIATIVFIRCSSPALSIGVIIKISLELFSLLANSIFLLFPLLFFFLSDLVLYL